MAGFDSLYTGITGLNAYQSWIDMISNNIANVDTTGFKGQRMTFADLFYQNQSFASAPTNTSGGVNGQQLGFGVRVNTVDTQFGQGGLQTTGINTDLAINGDGFFILNNSNGSTIPTYTRDGAFSLNSQGVLYDPASGLSVQGWNANANGVVTPGGTVGNITIPLGLQEQATATGAGAKVGPNIGDKVFDVAMGGNLDQTQWQQQFLGAVSSSAGGAPFTVSTTMYDSLGNAHEVNIVYTPDASGATAANLTAGGAGLNVTAGADIAAGSVISATAAANVVTVKSLGAGLGYTISDANGNSITATDGQAGVQFDGATLNLVTPAPAAGTTQSFTIAGATNGLPSQVQNAAGTDVKPATRWSVTMSFTDGTTFSAINAPGEINAAGAITTATTFKSVSSGTLGYVYFDQNGQFINSSTIQGDNTDAAGTAYTIGGANTAAYLHTTGVNPGTTQGNELNITLWGKSVGNNASAPTGTGAPTTGPIGLDYSNDASLAGSYTASVISQNGFASGTLNNITIGQDGSVVGAFTNGQQKTLAQVAIATFQNENGLSRVGGNQFEQTANSGLAQIGVAGVGRFGSIQSGALEQSNVSLANEFTNLIVAQRAFEANTRGITTADQNLQTVINLRASEN